MIKISRRTKSTIIWLILGIAGLSVFAFFYNSAFPVSSIYIKLSPKETFKKAEAFIHSQGFEVKGFDKTILFSVDPGASSYSQKTQGIKKSNELIRRKLPIWYWHARWFKELEKKNFVVDVHPTTGEIVGFYYSILDDEKGANLTPQEAITLAQNFLIRQGFDIREYELKSNSTTKQAHRTDYFLSWEKKNFNIKEATLRVDLALYGDTLGYYKSYLKIPETFGRELERETSLGIALTMLTSILMFLLIIAAVAVAVAQHKESKINWKFGAFFGSVVAMLMICSDLNGIPLLWNNYPNTISKFMFIGMSLGTSVLSAIVTGLLIFVYGSTGEPLARDLWHTKIPLIDAFKNKKFALGEISHLFVVGYSLGFIFLGYITLFYLIGTNFFNIWMPPQAEYSNMLGTILPFLFPLTIAISSAISEEFMFRLFIISFLKRHLKKTWVVIFISAVFWAYSHSNYAVFPAYVRGIELTIYGMVLGVAFLKYGLEVVVIAHFVINSLLVGLPLLRSHNAYFVISGLVVAMLALLPIPVFVILYRKNDKVWVVREPPIQ